jgi:hypothetical protein
LIEDVMEKRFYAPGVLLILCIFLSHGLARANEEPPTETHIYVPWVTTLQPYIANDDAILYSSGGSSYWDVGVVVGEIVNPLSYAICVSLEVTTFTSDGAFLDRRSGGGIRLDPVLPGEAMPFEIQLSETDRVAHYVLWMNYVDCTALREVTFTVASQEISFANDRGSIIRGVVRNDTSDTLEDPSLIAVFYDQRGRIILVREGLFVEGGLGPYPPGATLSYVVSSYFDLRGSIGGIRVIAHGRPTFPGLSATQTLGPVGTTNTGIRAWQPSIVRDGYQSADHSPAADN